MAEIKILVSGYVRQRKDCEQATPNTVLIFDGNTKVLVDPGSNPAALKRGLARQGLKPRDIDIVFLTHYHLDHLLNIWLFPKHSIYDGDTINRGDKIIDYNGKVIPKTNIKVIKTPGHAFEHCSLLAQTAKGKVAMAGDVWWWGSKEKQKTDQKNLLAKKDRFVKDRPALLASRKKLLLLADYIIPGHGKIFKVEK